jgi:hypothetical protein
MVMLHAVSQITPVLDDPRFPQAIRLSWVPRKGLELLSRRLSKSKIFIRRHT